ncbi:MAG: bifunctional phosphoribosylaminoimidazolecarboxamide formyltransferase/IMP cyclohydrolase [Bacteroidetes bacterium]|nr:bifunctional phosphoribosylaminoimidazolecarboxamide formyltransferase/IMP cyclohydrolase [Bacteroidota bacterium]
MKAIKKINSALISVYYKDNLEPIIRHLHRLGVTLYATGGTQEFIENLEIPVIPVEDVTDYPSILGGRVKTLHPKIFGGILSRREHLGDIAELENFHIPEIDLVIVDLYPFEETVASGADSQSIIEKIDIGGISLIRAAAKNFKDVLIIPSKDQYDFLLNILENNNGETSLEDRHLMASHAFATSSHYDSAIFNYFNKDHHLNLFRQSSNESKVLRYGENPHQSGIFYGNFEGLFDRLNGKEISYNNLLDIDAAISLLTEFQEPTVVIVKHNNACGLASRKTIEKAWDDALAGDPVSAFGGVICVNQNVSVELAEKMNSLFFEVLIAPDFDVKALEILASKKNRIILKSKKIEFPEFMSRSALNGILVQSRDNSTEKVADMTTVTKVAPTASQLLDLEFANKIVKHTKSNTIVIVKNGQLLASGTGQTSRVDALQQAIAKARHFKFDLNGTVMASDAFFPFPDCVEIADKAGIKAIIQPGGSVKDQESIDYCNLHGLAMVTTGKRHFKH